MNDDEKWKFIGNALDELKKASKEHGMTQHKMMIDSESPLIAPFNAVSGALIRALSALIGDDYSAIEWYVWENDFGEDGLEAGCPGEERPIRTVEDLRWMIELQC